MGKLIYLITTSMDGYVADDEGKFNWAMPTEEVHEFVNDTLRNVGMFLMGSRLYETMKVWDEIPTEGVGGPMDGPSASMNDFAGIWRAAKKIVYSTSLSETSIADTTIERSFDPAAVKQLIEKTDKDVDIGGPNLTGQAIKAGLLDDIHQIIAPVMIGSGNFWLPADVKANFELVNTRQFENGFVHLHYRKA